MKREEPFMNITKKNGRVVLYDTEKIVQSILKAGADTPGEEVSRHLASYIADEVFNTLTKDTTIITTKDVRECVYDKLCQFGLPQTAKKYIEHE